MSKRQSFLPASAPTESLTFTTTTTILYCSFMELIADRCNPLRPAGDSVPETLTTSRLKLFFFHSFQGEGCRERDTPSNGQRWNSFTRDWAEEGRVLVQIKKHKTRRRHDKLLNRSEKSRSRNTRLRHGLCHRIKREEKQKEQQQTQKRPDCCRRG